MTVTPAAPASIALTEPLFRLYEPVAVNTPVEPLIVPVARVTRPSVWLKGPRAKVPPLTVRLLPGLIAPPAPSASVPEFTVVRPE